MCTVTLVAEDRGYRLAMNRDEKIARGAGTDPEVLVIDGTGVLYPTDGADGTWIGVNGYGIALAVLNWNEPAIVGMEFRSRGTLIPAVSDSRTMAEMIAAVDILDLDRVRPFRLVGVFPAEKTVREWQWNTRSLNVLALPWESQHWFSSGLSDEQALRVRREVCSEAWRQADTGSSRWLRTLHASHTGGPAFGLCVHREDVHTLSYSEIRCFPDKIEMEHFLGNPCLMESGHSLTLRRLSALATAAGIEPFQPLEPIA